MERDSYEGAQDNPCYNNLAEYTDIPVHPQNNTFRRFFDLYYSCAIAEKIY